MVFAKGNDNHKKALDALRSPELKKAWADKEKIQQLYVSGKSGLQIAKIYNINYRSAYRIINSFQSDL